MEHYACLICEVNGSPNYVIQLGEAMDRHFKKFHKGIPEEQRSKFVEPHHPISIKVERDLGVENGRVSNGNAENVEKGTTQSLDNDWDEIKVMLDRKAEDEKRLKRQLVKKQEQNTSLEVKLQKAQKLLATRNKEKARLQKKMKLLQKERDELEKMRKENQRKIFFLEARCRRKDEWIRDLRLGNKKLDKKLEAASEVLNLM